MRTITVEEHAATPEFMAGPGRHLGAMPGGDELVDRLLDIGDGRIRAMDAAGIDLEVLSLTSPGTEQLPTAEAVPLARSVNDAFARAVTAHPTRLAAFAALPTADPQAAAAELERAVRELGLVGAMINGHTSGRYLDDEVFWPILERAEALEVPIYLHPTPPPGPVAASYRGNYSETVAQVFSTAGWGWHLETSFHVVRMMLGGVFDRFPRLQLAVGHLGEGLPFFLPRLDDALKPEVTGRAHPLSTYLRQNVHYSIAGFNFVRPFLDLLLEVGADRILFSADDPYRPMERARDFLDTLPVSDADREKIAHQNAERLLRLPTPPA